MKSKLRILAITLIMVLGFGLVSVNADATAYGITVDGVALTSEKTSVDAGSGTVSYNATAKELTLKNATISSTMDDNTLGVISIATGEAVTVKLVGTNTISNTGASQGILATSNLTITGDGSLSITTGGIGVYTANSTSLTIKDTTLNVTSTASDGIYATSNLVIDNSALDLKATGNWMGAISTYMTKDQLTFKNLTGKIFQKSNNSPITADTEASDPSRFDPQYGYSYVKISNKGILSKIAITLKEPVVGETPATTFTSTVKADGSATPVEFKEGQLAYRWFKVAKNDYVAFDDPTAEGVWTEVNEGEKFQKDYYYAFLTYFEVADGYEISDDLAVTVNGKKADIVEPGESVVGFLKYFGPLTEKAKSPATGDNNELGLFAVAGLISVAGVAFMLRRKHSM